MNISLKSSVVELLTEVTGVLGSIHSPAIFFVYFLNFLFSYYKSFNLGRISLTYIKCFEFIILGMKVGSIAEKYITRSDLLRNKG